MKRLAAYSFLGLCLSHCMPSVPSQPPTLVGRWEQMGVRTVSYDAAGQLLKDDYDENAPGSIWLEFTTAGTVYFWLDGFAKPTDTTYAHRMETIYFNDVPQGETAHPILTLSRHRLIYQSHKQMVTGTEDRTYTYRR